VQAVKNEAEKVYTEVYDKWQPIYEEQMNNKLPYAIAERKSDIEKEMRLQQPAIVEQAIQAKLDKEFNKDEEVQKEAKLNTEKVNQALAQTFPYKYAKQKLDLKKKMEDDEREQMTSAEEAIITTEAKKTADEAVESKTQILLDGAIAKRVAAAMPEAIAVKVEKDFKADYDQAMTTVLANELGTCSTCGKKIEKAIEKKKEEAIDAKMETDAAPLVTKAASDAVIAALGALAAPRIAAKKAQIIAEGTESGTLGFKLTQGTAAEKAAAEDEVAKMVADNSANWNAFDADPVQNQVKKAKIEKDAADAAESNLRASIKAQVDSDWTSPAKINALTEEVTAAEKKRLRPIVAADLIKNLKPQIEPPIRLEITQRETADVNAQKDAVLKQLHAALVESEKAKLMPAMNARLAKSIPAALDSAKFLAEVKAAQLELKEKLREEMGAELRKPLERVSKAKIREEEKENRDRIEFQVKAEQATLFAQKVAEATKTEAIEPAVKAEQLAKMKRNLKQKVASEVKAEVDKQLGKKLKEVITKKYEEGTLSQSMAFVKAHREGAIRQEVIDNINKKVEDEINAKLPGEKIKLKTKLITQLEKSILDSLQADAADDITKATKNMAPAVRSAYELTKTQELTAEAEAQAKTQAVVKMENGLTAQLKQQIKTQAETALKANLEKDVDAKVKAEAEEMSKKALEQKYRDDLDAMELGKNHVHRPLDKERTMPNIIDAAAAINNLALAGSHVGSNSSDSNAPTAAPVSNGPSNATTPAPTPAPTNATNATNLTSVMNATAANDTNDTLWSWLMW